MCVPLLARFIRPAVVVMLGLVVAAIGATILTALPSPDVVGVIGALSVLGFGHGVAFALIMDLIISSAPVSKTGSVSSTQEVSGELGSAPAAADRRRDIRQDSASQPVSAGA